MPETSYETSPAVRKAMACYHALSAVLKQESLAAHTLLEREAITAIIRAAAVAVADYYEVEVALWKDRCEAERQAHEATIAHFEHADQFTAG